MRTEEEILQFRNDLESVNGSMPLGSDPWKLGIISIDILDWVLGRDCACGKRVAQLRSIAISKKARSN